MKLIFRIARTHLLSKRRQTIIASLGVTFGIAMFIIMISFMTGVNALLEETTLASTPHIRMYYDVSNQRPSVLSFMKSAQENYLVVHHQKPKMENKNLKNGNRIVSELKKLPEITAVSAQVNSQVFYNYGPVQLSGSVYGVNIADENLLFDIESKLKSGSLQSLQANRNGILMGTGLAKKLNVREGDKVTITAPNGNMLVLKIVGTFKFSIGTIDNTRSYINLSTAQNLLGEGNDYITEVLMKMEDMNEAPKFAPKLEKMFGYTAEDWQTANQSILASFMVRNVLTGVVVITLLVVAGFGIYNIMNMTVYDKMKDIAILKATGFAARDIIGIFLAQAVFIGMIGGSLGLVIGFLISYAISRTPFPAGEFLSVDFFPVNFDPKFYIFGFAFGIITTIFAGYFPSRKASKVDPVSILRG